MKKLSGLVAVLAIVLAVASAFTTKETSSNLATAYFQLSTPVAETTFDNTSGSGSFKVVATYNVTPRTFAYLTEGQTPICNQGSDLVCGAKLEYGADSDLDQADLDPLSSIAEIEEIIFKSNP